MFIACVVLGTSGSETVGTEYKIHKYILHSNVQLVLNASLEGQSVQRMKERRDMVTFFALSTRGDAELCTL